MTWKQLFNTKIFGMLFNVAATLIVLILGQALMGKREAKSSLMQKIETRAPMEYVKEQDAKLQVSIDKVKQDMVKSDEQLKADLNNSVIEINTNLREIRNYIYQTKRGANQ